MGQIGSCIHFGNHRPKKCKRKYEVHPDVSLDLLNESTSPISNSSDGSSVSKSISDRSISSVANCGSTSPQPIATKEGDKTGKESSIPPDGEMSQQDMEKMKLLKSKTVPISSNGPPDTKSQPQESFPTCSAQSSHRGQDEHPHQSSVPPVASKKAGSKYETQYAKNQDKVYKMDTVPRGQALIINNMNFDNFSERGGSDKDETKIKDMLQYLGFEIQVKKNLEAEDMKICLGLFAKKKELESVSALCVVILTHGSGNDDLFGTDGKLIGNTCVGGTYITKVELSQYFTRSKCPLMVGKPKLFIIQACRGYLEDDLCLTDDSKSTSCLHYDTPGETEKRGLMANVCAKGADTSDMCFIYSASFGYKAYRGSSNGSPFVDILTKYVIQRAHEKEFRDIIQKVQRHFNERKLPNNMMTLPDFANQLTKKLFLNPPSDGCPPF